MSHHEDLKVRLEAIEDCVFVLEKETEDLDNWSTHWKLGFMHALNILKDQLRSEKGE